MLILLIVFITLQFTFNVSLLRIVYLPFTYLATTEVSVMNGFIIFLMVINIVVDVMKNTSPLIFLWNVEAEIYNEIKVVFYVLNIVSVGIPIQRI